MSGGLHIGVDATCWPLARGFGRHTRCLLTALLQVDRHNRYTFFTDSPEAAAAIPAAADVRLVRTTVPTTVGASAHGRRKISDLWKMSRALADASLDVLLFPSIYSYVPVFSRARKLVVFHDTTAERYPTLTLHSRRARLLWNTKVSLGRWQTDVILTVSDHSRAGIVERFKVPGTKVHVLGEASDPLFRVLENPQPTDRLTSLGINGTRSTIVYVGGFSPHKNLPMLVRVFATIAKREQFSAVDLLFVGDHEHDPFYSCFSSVKQLVEELALTDRVTFTGFLPDEDLVALLNLATVLVLPSLNEGFGLPAVEAAACGCPVIATTASPLPSLLGDSGIFVDPCKPEELERALVQVLESEDLRRQMRQTGITAAARLNWNTPARELIRIMSGSAVR